MEFKQNFMHKIPLLGQHLFFKYTIFYQGLRHRGEISKLRESARQLGEKILPTRRRQGENWYEISCNNKKKQNNETAINSIFLPRKISEILKKSQIRRIRLDCRLESGQIVETLLTILAAAPYLNEAPSGPSSQYIYHGRTLSALLKSENGVQQFCTRMRVRDDIFEIEYSYCVLYYSYALNNIILKRSKSNYRALFSLAPQAALSCGLIIFSLCLTASKGNAVGLALISGIITGTGTAYLLLTMGSIMYDQEHRDLQLKENMRQITALSHFPGNNPHPIIKMNLKGQVLYLNPAAKSLLTEVRGQEGKIEDILPDNYLELIRLCNKKAMNSETVEVNRYQKTIIYQLSPFANEQAVMLAGTDITRLKELERQLQRLNQSLEQKVMERTEELQRAQDVTIISLSSLAEARDPDTGTHIKRTRSYVKILADHLRHHPQFRQELDNDQTIELLYRSAPLHDIGKVGIADAILLKPGKLTEDEFEDMKRHPTIGGDALQEAAHHLGTDSFLKYAMQIAYNHHEKWDGSGYPQGLSGEDIPIAGRLMTIADVYDALISKRAYKEAFSHEKSKRIIISGSGTYFDPRLVEAFVEKEQDFHKIAKENTDL